MRFPSSHRWTICVTTKSPKGGSKQEFLHLALPFISSLQVIVYFKFGRHIWVERLHFVNVLKRAGLPNNFLKHFYTAAIRPILEYCLVVWNSPASLNQYRRGRFAQYTERLDRCRTIAYFIVVTLHPYNTDVPNKKKIYLHHFWTNLHAYIISCRSKVTTVLLPGFVRRSNSQCHSPWFQACNSQITSEKATVQTRLIWSCTAQCLISDVYWQVSGKLRRQMFPWGCKCALSISGPPICLQTATFYRESGCQRPWWHLPCSRLRQSLRALHLAEKNFIYVKAPMYINPHTKFQHVFSKFQFFNGQNGQEGGTTSLCQILSTSLQQWPRYRDFSIFQVGGRRHLVFSKFKSFNGWNGQEGQTASLCQM